jgi:hypothetical protein
VVAADDPQRAVVLEHPAAFLEPGAREGVVGLEALELVPVVVHGVDLGVVRPQKVAAQLEVVGRVGEHEVDGPVRQLLELRQAIARKDGVDRQAHASPQNPKTRVLRQHA